jgi:cell division protein ZapD
VILYEHPLNERVRTYLRLEDLFERLGELLSRDFALDHHYAFATVFDILELAQRSELKSDVLKDLEKHKQHMIAFRGNPGISTDALEGIISQIETSFSAVNAQTGKPGTSLQDNEWVTAVRSRMAILAGTCEFDIPAYYHWQHEAPERRRADLMRWASPLWPLAQAVKLVLKLLRDNGTAQRVMASGGQFQQNLPQGRSVQLVRLRIGQELGLVPEISGNRLIITVRLLRVTHDDKMPLAALEDAGFELTLCS